MWHVPAATAYNSRLPSFPPSLLPLRYVIVTRPDTTLRVFGTTNEISALQVGGGGGKDIAVVDRDAYRTLKLPKAPFKLLKPRLLAHLSTPPEKATTLSPCLHPPLDCREATARRRWA